jgi:hypothetical protein
VVKICCLSWDLSIDIFRALRLRIVKERCQGLIRSELLKITMLQVCLNQMFETYFDI